MGCHRASANISIQAYHSQLAEFDKRRISDNFRRPDGADTMPAIHRIILATDAMGMGIDNPDIRRVIQWRQPSSMCVLLQRAGQATRGRDRTGEFLWLVDSWCLGSRDIPENKSLRAKQDMGRKAHLDPALWELINIARCYTNRYRHFGE
jgi:superfamily II DNA helicase RecQ